MLTIVALSGSLRALSYNSALLDAAQRIAPAGMCIEMFTGMARLPLFNPDRAPQRIPAVRQLRGMLRAADGLLLASPEYAHGITGVMKNALDWLVDDPQLVNLPVALLNAAPRAVHAQAALAEVVRTMNLHLVEQACAAVPAIGSRLDGAGMAAAPAIAAPLAAALAAFAAAIPLGPPRAHALQRS